MLLRHVRYLVTVVDQGSFTRAALALHVSQPALSQQIRQLEERLGAQLLDRSGRTIRPTDSGEAFLAHARRALAELAAGSRAAQDVHDLSRGLLRIGFTPSFNAYLVGPLMERFHARYPAITLSASEMSQGDMEIALEDDALDLGIAFSEVEGGDIDWLPLHTERLRLIVGAGHPLVGRQGPMRIAELAGQRLVLLDSSFATRTTIDQYMRQHGIRPRISMDANSITTVMEIVRSGRLATILPDAVVRGQPGLCPVSLLPAIRARRVALLQRSGAYRTAAAKAFIDMTIAYTAEVDSDLDKLDQQRWPSLFKQSSRR
jgi:LysR family transcriptional regulator, cyn operon transcriptional activator